MQDLNFIQMSILKELLFKPKARFSELNVLRISSDQFSYHLKVLIESRILEKKEGVYSLTINGKEFANRMDVETNKIEKQPKVSMLIIPRKISKGKELFLIQKRLKEPYFGYQGFMTGKIRYSETVEEGAAREFFEETGLTAKFRHLFVLHEMVYSSQTHEMLEDKFFNVMEATNVKGTLVNEQGAENRWVDESEFLKCSPVYHNEFEIYEWYKSGNTMFQEKKYFVESF